MKKAITLIMFIALLAPCRAQEGMGYYYDYNNHFYAFEKGNNVELEGSRVDSVRAGIEPNRTIDYQCSENSERTHCRNHTFYVPNLRIRKR